MKKMATLLPTPKFKKTDLPFKQTAPLSSASHHSQTGGSAVRPACGR